MRLYRNDAPSLRYGAKIILDDLANGGLVTFGNVWWVDALNGSDSSDGKTSSTAFATITKATDSATTNNDDVILLSANSTTHTQTAMLTISKNRLHFVGLDQSSRSRSPRTRIVTSGAGAATDTAGVLISGAANTFHNIKFLSTFTAAENLSAVTVTGVNNFFENCDFAAQGTAHLTNENAASLIEAGAEGIYRNCNIGQWQLLTTSTNGQAMLIKAQGSTKAGGNIYDHCRFTSYTSDAGFAAVRSAAGSINSSQMSFDYCVFENRGTVATSGVALTAAMVMTAASGGQFFVSGAKVFGAARLGTSTGILHADHAVAADSTTTVGIQST